MRVLITGASSGIGRDLAREFAKMNYDIILVAKNIKKLESLKTELVEKYNIKVKYYSIDLCDEKECISLYEKEKNIDILINNAGLGDFGFFNKTNLEKDLQIIKTDIIALHILTKLYLNNMIKKNKGKILNVASIAGFLPGPLMATYYASKNYVVKLSEAIREEIKKQKSDVQISVLCPGPVRTNFNNVANVKFEISSLSSEYVAKYTIKKFLKNKFYIIPGFQIKCVKFFSKFIPTPILVKCTYYMQKRKEG